MCFECVSRLKEHVSQVSDIMQQNIDKILERGSRLDNLEDRSEQLSNRADEFRVGARRVSRKMWWQNMRINIFIGVVVVIVILIIVCEYISCFSYVFHLFFICFLTLYSNCFTIVSITETKSS